MLLTLSLPTLFNVSKTIGHGLWADMKKKEQFIFFQSSRRKIEESLRSLRKIDVQFDVDQLKLGNLEKKDLTVRRSKNTRCLFLQLVEIAFGRLSNKEYDPSKLFYYNDDEPQNASSILDVLIKTVSRVLPDSLQSQTTE